MASNETEHLTILGIRGTADHSVYYYLRHDDVIPPGRGRDSFIEETLRSGQVFNDRSPDHRHADAQDQGYGNRNSERSLDIKEKRKDGRCTYIFHLDTSADGHELTFVEGKPFIFLPLNYQAEEKPLTALDSKDFGEGRFASFTYQLSELYDSPLAHHIRNMAKKHEHAVQPRLNIPFCLNVRDSKLKASPWVVPRHSHSVLPFFTHGGVHPPEVSFIEMEL